MIHQLSKRPGLSGRKNPVKTHGFTLIEMLLAISLITGLLILAMLFYRQATVLRGQILKESQRVSAVRLVMDRMVADLRSVRTGTGSEMEFRGDGSSASFVTALPLPPISAGVPGSDLVRVTLSTVSELTGTNYAVSGFLRREESLNAVAPVTLLPGGTMPVSALSEMTNQVPAVEPTTDLIRYARFRYWDGAAWQTGWTNSAPPTGVEIVLGTEPQPDDATFEEYPYEQFRRVVYVPSGRVLVSPDAEQFGFPSTP